MTDHGPDTRAAEPRSPAAERLDAILRDQLADIRAMGTYKSETLLVGPQRPALATEGGPVVNFCANDYLGLASHPEVLAGIRRGLDERGAGMASVRFICGTQDEHRGLERDIAAFLGYADAILYSSCFAANGGLFPSFLGADDVVLSDALNHASIIDGIRLAKARSVVYRHADMADLRDKLEETAGARLRLIATDGVFSMEGDVAPLPEILQLASEHGALVMVDDSHGVGVVGPTGRGTAELFGLAGAVDVQTGTFGKALGGTAGGYTVASPNLVELLRQLSRPYLFSNSLPPPVVGGARAAISLLDRDSSLLERLQGNTRRFRSGMLAAGFTVLPGTHPIVAVMVGDERRAMELSAAVREAGILVVAFSHPVVPVGQARIRVQVSAAHTDDEIDRALGAFTDAGRSLGLVDGAPS